MAFKVPEEDIGLYYKEGYIVFRNILPTSLISDLRRECDKAVAVVRREMHLTPGIWFAPDDGHLLLKPSLRLELQPTIIIRTRFRLVLHPLTGWKPSILIE